MTASAKSNLAPEPGNVFAAFGLHEELVLITGGASGLGFSMAKCMAAAGARIVILGRREAMLKTAASAIGPQAGYLAHDVTHLADAPSLVEKVTQRFGPITILVNNAGIHLKKGVIETTEEEFLNLLTTHVLGAHALSRAVLPGMLQRRHGSILFIASMASLFGIPKVTAYSAAKSAFLGMVRAMATELSPHEIRVNAIAPGWITTEMSAKALEADPARKEKILARTPIGRMGEPDDVGLAAVYLCSGAAKFVTGIVLPVDGGASIGF